jgi:hypothetical protein
MSDSFDELRARVVGARFPGGTFRVEDYERWLSHDAMHAPPLPAGLLHPVWILLGALRGMGLSTDELTALADADSRDGTLFGETEFEQHRVLRAGVEYAVRGEVSDLVRREGTRAGRIDLMTFRLEIVETTGEVAAVSTQTFVFPRRSGPHAE